jgi:hypothetical protein
VTSRATSSEGALSTVFGLVAAQATQRGRVGAGGRVEPVGARAGDRLGIVVREQGAQPLPESRCAIAFVGRRRDTARHQVVARSHAVNCSGVPMTSPSARRVLTNSTRR